MTDAASFECNNWLWLRGPQVSIESCLATAEQWKTRIFRLKISTSKSRRFVSFGSRSVEIEPQYPTWHLDHLHRQTDVCTWSDAPRSNDSSCSREDSGLNVSLDRHLPANRFGNGSITKSRFVVGNRLYHLDLNIWKRRQSEKEVFCLRIYIVSCYDGAVHRCESWDPEECNAEIWFEVFLEHHPTVVPVQIDRRRHDSSRRESDWPEPEIRRSITWRKSWKPIP